MRDLHGWLGLNWALACHTLAQKCVPIGALLYLRLQEAAGPPRCVSFLGLLDNVLEQNWVTIRVCPLNLACLRQCLYQFLVVLACWQEELVSL